MENDRFEQYPYRAPNTGEKVVRLMGLAFIGIMFAALFALVFGLLVKWLWNGLMPDIFGLGPITYWQAFGLVILAKLLFGGFGHHFNDRPHPHSRSRHIFEENASSRESRRSRHFEHWQHYGRFWREEGRAAFNDFLKRMTKQDHEKPGNPDDDSENHHA